MKMKKKLLSLILVTSTILNSQTFVSTNPENKNIVLEEFTGIHCGYCPDGHVVAQNIYDQNPGDVILINIHTGGYATPSAGEPDFRTNFGDDIANQSNLSGYPAGTVNRHQFSMSQSGGTAMSRGDWTNASSQILNQPSYINVAAQSTININTRELTVVVETFYTGTPPSSITNTLNVALLQNNVAGPQSGAANWNPSAIISGPWNPTYNHQHMLRHLLTGQWGENLPNSSGFYTNTYTYSIPNNLNGVDYDLFNLEVAVFIAEGQQEIISGAVSSMNFIVPNGTNLIDLSSNSNINIPSSYCDNVITPEITVYNNTFIPVDTFVVSYTLNSNQPVSQTIFNTILGGGSTNIIFPTITLPSGTNKIDFNCDILNGTSYIDYVSNNNSSSSGEFSILSPTSIGTNYTENFEGYDLATPSPNNAILIEDNGNWVGILDPTYTSGVPVGGFGNSQNSFRWRFGDFNPGEHATLIFDKLDFSNTTNNEVSFSYAHANKNSWDIDKLQILVSTDCFNTFQVINEISGTNLHTASILWPSSPFYPTSQDWNSIVIDLSSFDGVSDVSIGFRGIYGGGNNLYIDDINIQENSSTTNLSEEINDLKISLLPNPTKDEVFFNIELEIIELYDLTGKLLKRSKYQEKIDLSNLEKGTYLIKINHLGIIRSQRIVKN
ncbi:MAG: hypothetical protein CMP51_01420 [Flavobacteriales bacterium]|nr:hypothetical protein [Flavobacteriales bacterium]|tara:strand:+ start:832 stop:2829 length:1998 start_codon:yes stop_codon:yes gene_type:complete